MQIDINLLKEIVLHICMQGDVNCCIKCKICYLFSSFMNITSSSEEGSCFLSLHLILGGFISGSSSDANEYPNN